MQGDMVKRVALLGSTGSIGTQALQVIDALGYKVTALAAGRNIGLLKEQIQKYSPSVVGVQSQAAAQELQPWLATLPAAPVLLTGAEAAKEIAAMGQADVVLNAIVGFAGLTATLAALQAGTDVALANKESLVAGGGLVMQTAQKSGAKLLPVDSEHSAIFQCLQDQHSAKALKKILLTASGGPFYGKKAPELTHITAKQALKHPNWSMGPKITIDSATLMNKGLELIEAMWLFNVPPQDIEVVVQPQSIIHSMVQFNDHSVLGQLGVPDMRIPIQYALTWPQRMPGPAPELDFAQLAQLTFGQPDETTFLCLAACRSAANKGGLAPCAANAANEEAVALFLQDKISFLQIGELVQAVVEKESYAGAYTLADIIECDRAGREFVRQKAGAL